MKVFASLSTRTGKELKMAGLDGKKVVITGAASGLGRSLALALARKGCRIGIADVDTAGAEETLDIVVRNGGSGEVYKLDARVAAEVGAMAEHFFASWGGVDLLVNNAGVGMGGFTGEIPLEDWEWLISLNFWGMVYGCHFFIPRMKAQGGGHILNVASAMGITCMGEMAPYNTSKAAIISLSETLYSELASDNIGVTALCPMFFNTNLMEHSRFGTETERDIAYAAFNYSRMTSDEVAEAAIKAVGKGKLYCVPMLSGKLHWMIKRISPQLYYGSLAFFSRHGWLNPLELWMARKGLV
jgi:NAD(P)-dependent dehydrogenase (short-subunit alcohol dehydrogenase family)